MYLFSIIACLSFSGAVSAAIVVPDQYIVVFKDNILSHKSGGASRTIDTGETIRELAERLIQDTQGNERLLRNKGKSLKITNKLEFVYEEAIQGFSATLSKDGVKYLSQDPMVKYIESDIVIKGSEIQVNPPWGLDRIDQLALPVDSLYESSFDGSNVHAYIIDSGIRASHNEFRGRVSSGYDFVDDDNRPNDCHGHGTHVAGTVGGTTYGVAKGVTLHPVRVLDCSNRGQSSKLIAGIDWVRKNASFPAVINLSIELNQPSRAVDSAIRNAIAARIITVVAAGNNAKDACETSPGRIVEAIVVAASTINDQRRNSSNIGACVDLFAPGQSILSASIQSDTSTLLRSGTSMASPHVAGTVALFLERNRAFDPVRVAALLIDGATHNIIANAGTGTPNRLLNTKFIEDIAGLPDPVYRGPAGGKGGKPFEDFTEQAGFRISAITVRSGSRVDAIQVTYIDAAGRLHQRPRRGGGGGRSKVINLSEDEYVIAVSGSAPTSGRKSNRIHRLDIVTNKGRKFSFGRGRGTNFKFEGKVVGIFGRSGRELDAIGVITR